MEEQRKEISTIKNKGVEKTRNATQNLTNLQSVKHHGR